MRKFLGAVSLAALVAFGPAAPAFAEQPTVQQVKQAQNEDGGGNAGLWGLLGLLGLLGAMGMRKAKPKVGTAESRTGTDRREGPGM